MVTCCLLIAIASHAASSITARAWIDREEPCQNDTITVVGRLFDDGRPVVDAPMQVRVSYHTAYTDVPWLWITQWCPQPRASVLTDARGIAACRVRVQPPDIVQPAGRVQPRSVQSMTIDVNFRHRGHNAWAQAVVFPRPTACLSELDAVP
jgi:hypothetical protein